MLFLLKRKNDVGWDECEAKVIRAGSFEFARCIANLKVGDEGKIWENKKLVTCVEIDGHGPSEEILGSFKAR